MHSFTFWEATLLGLVQEIWRQMRCDPKHGVFHLAHFQHHHVPLYSSTAPFQTPHLQAMRTVLWALNCSRLTTMTTSVRMSRLRSRLRLRRTSLAWRVNWIQLSAGEAILSSPEKRGQNPLEPVSGLPGV